MSDELPTEINQRLHELERAVEQLNGAVFIFVGIASRTMVEHGIIARTDLADAIERRAGPIGQDNHNPLLLAFSRAIRMNLPGGRFEVIDGGRSDLDPS